MSSSLSTVVVIEPLREYRRSLTNRDVSFPRRYYPKFFICSYYIY